MFSLHWRVTWDVFGERHSAFVEVICVNTKFFRHAWQRNSATWISLLYVKGQCYSRTEVNLFSSYTYVIRRDSNCACYKCIIHAIRSFCKTSKLIHAIGLSKFCTMLLIVSPVPALRGQLFSNVLAIVMVFSFLPNTVHFISMQCNFVFVS